MGDVAQSVLLHRVGAMPPGTSAVFALLAKGGRRILAGRYLAVYRRSRPVDQERFDRWLFVHAAARLGEPVEDEHPALLALLDAPATSGRRSVSGEAVDAGQPGRRDVGADVAPAAEDHHRADEDQRCHAQEGVGEVTAELPVHRHRELVGEEADERG